MEDNYNANGGNMYGGGGTQDPEHESNMEELRLRRAFDELDRDGNGVISRDEMDQFLASKGIDDDHRI